MKVIDSPDHVRQIISKLIQGQGKTYVVQRGDISQEDLSVLDAHAREVMGDDDCEITSVEGCNSCCADGISGSLRHTTCGDFCDKVCGEEPCF